MDLSKVLNYTYKIGAPSGEPIPVKVTIDATDQVMKALKFTGVAVGSMFVLSALIRYAATKKAK